MSLQRHDLHILALMVMLSCAAGLPLFEVHVSDKKHLGLDLHLIKLSLTCDI